MSTVHQREVAVDVHPVARHQFVNVGERDAVRPRPPSLGATGVVGLNQVFRMVGRL